MAGSNLLLDTSAVIAVLRGVERIKAVLEAAEQVAIPSIVLGELYYGAYNSSASAKHLKQVTDLLSVFDTVEVNPTVAETYGHIKAELRKAGKPIPENDIWIAAMAMTNGFELVTSDAHFDYIPDLEKINP